MQKLIIKVKNGGSREDCSYRNEINLADPKMIALVLDDLETQFDAPIQKAVSIIKRKNTGFPF